MLIALLILWILVIPVIVGGGLTHCGWRRETYAARMAAQSRSRPAIILESSGRVATGGRGAASPIH